MGSKRSLADAAAQLRMDQGSQRGIREAEGLRVVTCAALEDRLIADFSIADRGYRQFAAVTDERERAALSDETCQAVQAVGTNLMEMRLHEKDLASLVAAGLPLAGTGSPPSHYEAAARVDQHLAGFFRALGSTVDCLAAAAIGILLAPRDILKAGHLDLLALDDGRARATAGQRAAWQSIQAAINEHREREPRGWLDWSLETRNAIVHRARQLSMLMPSHAVEPRAAISVVTDDPVKVVTATSRGVPHLRRRPWLGDLPDLGSSARIGDIWLLEPAIVTLMGLREHLNDLVEGIAGQLLIYWEDISCGAISLLGCPTLRRRAKDLPVTSRESFSGFAPPIPLPITFGALHPHAVTRVELATDLWGRRRDQ